MLVLLLGVAVIFLAVFRRLDWQSRVDGATAVERSPDDLLDGRAVVAPEDRQPSTGRR